MVLPWGFKTSSGQATPAGQHHILLSKGSMWQPEGSASETDELWVPSGLLRYVSRQNPHSFTLCELLGFLDMGSGEGPGYEQMMRPLLIWRMGTGARFLLNDISNLK